MLLVSFIHHPYQLVSLSTNNLDIDKGLYVPFVNLNAWSPVLCLHIKVFGTEMQEIWLLKILFEILVETLYALTLIYFAHKMLHFTCGTTCRS